MPCLEPVKLDRSDRAMVPCGKCAWCRDMRQTDMVGQLMAEAASSKATWFLSLTYKDEPETFVYRHVQLMLKRLRFYLWEKHRCRVRFFACGEIGEKFARKHWHVLLFFDRPIRRPFIKPGDLWEFWPHGWTRIVPIDPGTTLGSKKLKYCAKYLFKQQLGAPSIYETVRARWSTKPVLGYKFLLERAIREVKAGLAPSFQMWFDGARVKRTGGHFFYRMTRRQMRVYAIAYAMASYDRFGDLRAIGLIEGFDLPIDLTGPVHATHRYLARQRALRESMEVEKKCAAAQGVQPEYQEFWDYGDTNYLVSMALGGPPAAVAFIEGWRKILPDQVVFQVVPFSDYHLFDNPPALPVNPDLLPTDDRSWSGLMGEIQSLPWPEPQGVPYIEPQPPADRYYAVRRQDRDKRAREYWASRKGVA